MSALDTLDRRYRVILCDLWGCVHDGVRLYPDAAERLIEWRGQGRTIILITNAPRTADAVAGQLARIGLDESAWDGIATSGEAAIAALLRCLKPLGFIGTPSDRTNLERSGVRIADGEDFDELACSGHDGEHQRVGDYEPQLRDLADRGVVMHCLNPDRLVIRDGMEELCAGALADLYVDLGGRVEWYGKPHPAIYARAMELAGNPPADQVLAIGDGLQTDVLGAARMGFACIFVTGGINRGEAFPPNFASEYGLGDWRPVAVVDSLD